MSHVCQHDTTTSYVDDPALAACCQRDESVRKHAEKVKELLLSFDRTTARVQQRRAIVTPPVNDICHVKETVLCVAEDDYDSEEFDEGLEEIYAARRTELRIKQQEMLQCAAQGYGIVAQVDLCTFLNNISRDDQVLAVITDTTSPLNRAIQEQLSSTAQKYLGTQFSLSVAASVENVTSRLFNTSVGVPCVAAFCDRKLVNQTSLKINSDVNVAVYWEAHVLQWLQMCHILNIDRSVSNIQKQQLEQSTDQDTKIESGYDCGVEKCRLRYSYEHEHVAPSDSTKQEISAWRN